MRDFLFSSPGRTGPLTSSCRYFGQAVLDSIHRSVAIEQWHALADPRLPDPDLEKLLGAFDMFVLRGEFGDLDDVGLFRLRIATHSTN